MALSASDVWEALDLKLMAAGVKLDMEAQDAEAAEQTIQGLDQVEFILMKCGRTSASRREG